MRHSINLICSGEMCKHMAQAARDAGGCKEVVYVENLDSLKEVLPGLIKKDDTVLVKASHGMHFENVVNMLREL